MNAKEFALLCSGDRKRYKKMDEYWKNCQTKLPFTVYMGYLKKNVNLQKFADSLNIDLIVPQKNENEGYDWIVVNHPIIVGKNFFFHFNPLEPISLNRILVGNRKTEWNDPRENEDSHMSKIMIAPKKVLQFQLPIEIKLQTGSLMTTEETKMFMKNLIEEMQSELNEEELIEFRSIREFQLYEV